MQLNDKVQHVYLVGAKSLGAYGGYETFVYKLTEYHQNKENIKYHVACKANGDGCMDESKFEGVTKINDHEFELHNFLYGIWLLLRNYGRCKNVRSVLLWTGIRSSGWIAISLFAHHCYYRH